MKTGPNPCVVILPTPMEFTGYITGKPETGMVINKSKLKEHFYVRNTHFLKFFTLRSISQ